MAHYQLLSSESAIDLEHIHIWKNAKHIAKEAPLRAVHIYKEQVSALYTRPDVPVAFLLSRLRQIQSDQAAKSEIASLKAGLISGLIGSFLFSYIAQNTLTDFMKIVSFLIVLVPLSLIIGYYIVHASYRDARSLYPRKSFSTYYKLFLCDWEINLIQSLLKL